MINPVYPTLITGTITGCRVSNVASYYFLDNLPAAVLQFAGSGDAMHIYDDAGKIKKVTLGALGTGETLDATNKFTNPSFTSGDVNWTKEVAQWTIADVGAGDYEGVATACASAKSLYQVVATTSGALYLLQGTITNYTSGGARVYGLNGAIAGTAKTETGDISLYLTGDGTGKSFGFMTSAANTTLRVDDGVFKKVLTPSSSGLWYTPVSEESGWNPNAATYTYRILARRIASGAGGYYK